MKNSSNFKYLRYVCLAVLLCLSLACIEFKGVRPSKISILDFEGETQDELVLAQGMTHRLYSGVYAKTFQGDLFLGDAESKSYLTDVSYEVLSDSASNSVLSVTKNGCLLAKNAGTALVRLKAFHLDRGRLESVAQVTVQSNNIGQTQVLQSGQINNFSMAAFSQFGQTSFGFTINNRFNFLNAKSATAKLNSPGGVAIATAAGALKSLNTIADNAAQGYIVSYGRHVADEDDRLAFAVMQSDGKLNANFESTESLDLHRTYAVQLQNTSPIIIGLSRVHEKDKQPTKMRFYGFQHLLEQGANEAFIRDRKTSEILELTLTPPEVDNGDIDRVIQFAKGSQNVSFLAMGSFIHKSKKDSEAPTEEDINRLKIITFDAKKGTFVDEITQANLGSKKAFSIDATFGNAKALFINPSNQVVFTQRLGGVWGNSFLKIGENADPSFSPKLISNVEDGSMAAAWKSKNGKIQVTFSEDGGLKWLDQPREVNLTNLADLDLISLPCNGAGLFTSKGGSLSATFVSAMNQTISTHQVTGASGVQKTVFFRDHGKVRLFFHSGSQFGLTQIP